ncbi:MAG TPA: molybdate ABC transporter substrate-binding protein [Pyrinomonadaceae bacterium]|jgi:molybdate transport system substrate-binding protein|nr:molybdate ABC transporter substrate-binding protein [Pyrinomonadaceae bacterium]
MKTDVAKSPKVKAVGLEVRKPVSAPPTVKACVALLALALALSAGACSEPEAQGDEITVAAAANLTDAFGEMAKRFTARTGVKVTNSFGATADLSKQIENGAPFDVFASADVEHVEALARAGLLADAPRGVYARGRLVLWLPPGGKASIARVEDLAGGSVSKVAVAKPDVAPYGRAAVETLNALGLWAKVEPKVVYSQTVAQAKQFASSGNAEAAFVPRSLVREGEGTAIEIDARLHAPIEQAVGVVRASKRQDAARRFVEFLTGEEGRSVLKSFGYDAPAK